MPDIRNEVYNKGILQEEDNLGKVNARYSKTQVLPNEIILEKKYNKNDYIN